MRCQMGTIQKYDMDSHFATKSNILSQKTFAPFRAIRVPNVILFKYLILGQISDKLLID